MGEEMPDFISIGECMIEFFAEQPIGEAESFTRSLAGDSLNILVAAQRMGTSTGYITRLGNDPFTDYLLKVWHTEGINTENVVIGDGFNAVHFVVELPDGDRDFVYYRKGSEPSKIQPSDLIPSYIQSSKLFHFSGISQAISNSSYETVKYAIEIASEADLLISYDPNFRAQLWTPEDAKKAMMDVIDKVDFFLPSNPTDCQILFGTDDPYKVVEASNNLGVPNTIVTCGESGALIAVNGEIFHQPAYKPELAISTTGAGDAFSGAFLSSYLRGMSPKDSAKIASIASGLKVRGRGALPTMPSQDDVMNIFKEPTF